MAIRLLNAMDNEPTKHAKKKKQIITIASYKNQFYDLIIILTYLYKQFTLYYPLLIKLTLKLCV